jgi:hypothetical protein
MADSSASRMPPLGGLCGLKTTPNPLRILFDKGGWDRIIPTMGAADCAAGAI